MLVTYCSFADKVCLGVLVLEGNLTPVQAAAEATRLGKNPGGELLALPIDTDDPDVPAHVKPNLLANIGRLMSAEEASELFDAERAGERIDQVRGELFVRQS